MIEPFRAALDRVPGAHPYPRTSRYYESEIGVHRRGDGSEVRYVKRRLLPPLPGQDEVGPHTVSEGERPDQLGQLYLRDSEQWWRIADANPVLDPRELTSEAGRVIDVPEEGTVG